MSVSVPDSTMSCIDAEVKRLGVNRSHFVAEAIDLASAGFDTPYYMREMSILEKIKDEPGIQTEMIIKRFTDWERDEIFPPLTPVMVELMLSELSETGYIRIDQGKVYPQERESLPEPFAP